MSRSHVTVIEDVSPTERKRWRFWFSDDFKVYVDGYVHEARASSRHRRWEPVSVDEQRQVWSRLGPHHVSDLQAMPMPPGEVIAQALTQFSERIQFGGEFKR